MALPKLITDSTPELLELEGRMTNTEQEKDPQTFFKFLAQKVDEDFKRMLEATDIDKKINALSDLYVDLDEYKAAIKEKEPDIERKILERAEKMGAFKKRLILQSVEKTKWTREDIAFIREEGKRAGYPRVNVKRNDQNIVYCSVDAGEEAWNKQLAQTGNPFYQDELVEFIAAVRRRDYDEKKE